MLSFRASVAGCLFKKGTRLSLSKSQACLRRALQIWQHLNLPLIYLFIYFMQNVRHLEELSYE